jgi:divalent metal cation (Fe/Co/Zn/Cd) transporter
MNTDQTWITIIANAIFVTVSIANAWIIAWYNKKDRRKGKAKKAQSHLARTDWRVSVLSTIGFGGSITALVIVMLFPFPNSSVQALHISLYVAYAVLAVVFRFYWYLARRISEQSEQIGDIVNLIGEATRPIEDLAKAVSAVVKPEATESPNPSTETDVRKTSGSP